MVSKLKGKIRKLGQRLGLTEEREESLSSIVLAEEMQVASKTYQSEGKRIKCEITFEGAEKDVNATIIDYADNIEDLIRLSMGARIWVRYRAKVISVSDYIPPDFTKKEVIRRKREYEFVSFGC